MPEQFHKPVRRPSDMFDHLFGGPDASHDGRVAHTTAQALLARVREDPDPRVVDRLVAFAAEHGIDTIADLWAHASARSLPGALWRLYLLQAMVRADPDTTSLLYERGSLAVDTVDRLVAGAVDPAGPAELARLVDTILRGVFEGDFAIALDRAAAFCRLESVGATHVADDYERSEPERAEALTARALRLSTFAGDLTVAARMWREGRLV